MRCAWVLGLVLVVACGSSTPGGGTTDGGTSCSPFAPCTTGGDSGKSDVAQADTGAADSGTPQDGTAPPADAPAPLDTGTGPTSIEQHCVDQINMYRAMLSLPPYTRDPSQEMCADGEAKSDAMSGVPHGAFPSCSESAQNECPGWPSADEQGSLDGCLAQMWAEGPGSDFSTHGHYINMSSTQYTHVFCGFYVVGDGTFWSVQDFY